MKNSYGGVEGCRDYDTLTSRWTAPDPMGDAGGDDDWYGCCLDDPVNGVDPLGLMGEGLFGRLFSQLGILFSPNEADAAELSTDMEAGTTTFDPRPEIPKGKLTTIETRNRVTRNSAPGADGPFNTDDVQVLKAMPKSRQKSFGPDGHILILLILEEETSMEVEGKSLKTRLNLAKDGIQQKGVQGVKTRMSSSLVKTFLIFKNDSQESKYLMNVSRVVIIALVLIGLGACTAKTYQGQRGLKCLGPICLERGKIGRAHV